MLKPKEEKYKGENYRKGFLAGSKEGFRMGFTAGLKRALEVKPKEVELVMKFHTPNEANFSDGAKGFNGGVENYASAITKEIEKKK